MQCINSMCCFPVLVLWHRLSLGLLSSFVAPFPPLRVFRGVIPAIGYGADRVQGAEPERGGATFP